MSAVAAWAFAVSGLGALAMVMQRHEHAFFSGKGAGRMRRVMFRLSGSLMLVAALRLCVREEGVGVGLVLWCALLTVAAWAVVALMVSRGRWVPTLTASLLLFALLTVSLARGAHLEHAISHSHHACGPDNASHKTSKAHPSCRQPDARHAPCNTLWQHRSRLQACA